MGSWYVLLLPSRVAIDAEAGVQKPATVLLVKGLLVTTLVMCHEIGAEGARRVER